MKNHWKTVITLGVITVAIAAVLLKYQDYVVNPWTRDGQVRAQVVQIAPRISGPIVSLPIADNQLVRAGDLLFEIDPRTYQAAVQDAEAQLEKARVELADAADEAERAENIFKRDRGAMSEQQLIRKQNDRRSAKAAVEMAQAALTNAQLNLEFTRQKAPVDGYVTNLNLRIGSQAVANQPMLALVDVNSFWIHGYFRENYIEDMRKGDAAIITLMSYPDTPLEGRVDSLGWGIAQSDGSTGYNLLPTINPTFEWIRLAQRIPVRIHLESVPENVQLRVGSTASVLVMTAKSGRDPGSVPEPVPAALQ